MTASAQALREVVGTEQNGVTCQGPSHGTWKANMAEILFCSLPFSGSTQNKDRETRDKGVVAMPNRQRSPKRLHAGGPGWATRLRLTTLEPGSSQPAEGHSKDHCSHLKTRVTVPPAKRSVGVT